MSLEASIIILDNSAWSINGDFYPTRFEAQLDAANLLQNAKQQLNQESSVGLMTMGGNMPQLLATPLNDNAKFQAVMFGIKLSGKANFKNAISIAQLALKHRQNKKQRQRIIVFVASPLSESIEQLESLAKKTKKNGVAVDVINVGEQDEGHIAKLQKFVETVNNNNSYFLNIKSGTYLSDQLIGTPIMSGGQEDNFGGGQNVNQGGQGGAFNPNSEEQQLQMAMLMSMEESKQKNENQKDKMQPEQQQQQQQNLKPIEELDEEELLRKALEMSLQEDNQNKQENQQQQPQQQEQQKPAEPSSAPEQKQEIQDQEFVNKLKNEIEDPEIKKALEELEKQKKEENDKKK